MSIARQYGFEKSKPALAKKSTDRPSGNLPKALDAIEKIETQKREPKKPLSKQKAQVGARISETVVTAFREGGGNYASHVEAALLEYALKQGWL